LFWRVFLVRGGSRFARKRYGALFLGWAHLVLGSIVNAAADGKRLRAIDALQRGGIVRPNGSKTA
jgi:hypothetical protein